MSAPPAFLLFVSSLASGAERSDPAQPAHVADVAALVWEASRDAPRPRAEWAALLATVGGKESALSMRIMRNECRPWECDRGKARGIFQIHRNAHNRDDWHRQDGDLGLQVRLAHAQLRRAYFTCSRSGASWLGGTLSAYAGRQCGSEWPGLAPRVFTWLRGARLLGAL